MQDVWKCSKRACSVYFVLTGHVVCYASNMKLVTNYRSNKLCLVAFLENGFGGLGVHLAREIQAGSLAQPALLNKM